jgi:hypothetical protein
MSISPFQARPGTPAGEGRRARLVVLLVALGIAASLLAYAISPGVRHAVGHAAHSVGRVLDRDKGEHKPGAKGTPARTTTAPHSHTGTAPARKRAAPPAHTGTTPAAPTRTAP